MSRRSILIVSEKWWPDNGGGPLATYLITKLLANYFNVIVLTGSRTFEKINNVKFIQTERLKANSKHELWLKTLQLSREQWFRNLVEKVDVVYVPGFSFPIIPLAKRMNRKVVVHLHGYIPVSYTAVIPAPYEQYKKVMKKFNIWLESRNSIKHVLVAGFAQEIVTKLARTWISQADKVLCVSNRHASIVGELAPELRGKIAVVYNPPPEASSINKELTDNPLLIYVGGNSFIKGFHILLSAIPRLIRSGVRLRLFGDYRRVIKMYNAEFVGRIPHDRLMQEHRYAWGLLFPSINEEPLPYAVIESAVSGTVPLVSNAGGAVEVLRGTPAEKFVFRVNDPSDLVDKVLSLVAEGSKHVVEMGLETREVVVKRLEESSRQLIRHILSTVE